MNGILIKNQFCKTVSNRRDYLGERYFRYNDASETVVQVCVTQGEQKKGRSNTFGVHVIAKMTLFANYMAMNYTIPCTKAEYEKKFNKVVKMLR